MIKKENLHKSSTKITERLFHCTQIIFRGIYWLSIIVNITGVINFNQQLEINLLQVDFELQI